MNTFRAIVGAGLLFFSTQPPGFSEEVPPASAPAAAMSQDQLEEFFAQQKKGAPLQLTLGKGKVVKGLFSSFDDYYETVWMVPRKGEEGVFKEKGYRLAGIHSVEPWGKAPASSAGGAAMINPVEADASQYYLFKGSGSAK